MLPEKIGAKLGLVSLSDQGDKRFSGPAILHILYTLDNSNFYHPDEVGYQMSLQEIEHAVCPSVCLSDVIRLQNHKGSRAKLGILLKSMTRGRF